MNRNIVKAAFSISLLGLLTITGCEVRHGREGVVVYSEPAPPPPPQPLPPPPPQQEVIVDAPPPDRYEVPPPPPAPNYIWVRGYWARRHHGYEWVPGHYVVQPYHAANWIPDHWVRTDRGYVFVPGHWDR